MTQADQHPQLPPPLQVLNMAMINWMIAHAIQVATLYGIADLLQGGPSSVAELASATCTHPDSLYRLLRALATVGIFAETNTDAQGLEERYFCTNAVVSVPVPANPRLDVRTSAAICFGMGA